ncbi:MAG: hypothetical protein GWP91_14860, partial [Rhodobacterales bacterium]|nr:hypothetical protein [Rhodobacterales bacterium]
MSTRSAIVRTALLGCVGLLWGCPTESIIASEFDQDQDGQAKPEGDCDDENPLIGLGFDEICDGLDNNCNGFPDSGGICEREERFNQIPVLDLLFVIDGSCSMTAERLRVSEGVVQMVPHVILPFHDVHVGVITMDMTALEFAGKLVDEDGRRWVDGTENQEVATAWLQSAVSVDGVGQPLEQARAAVTSALVEHRDTANEGFRRPDADLALVMISDEDDNSAAPSYDDFRDWLAEDPGLGRVTVHAIVGTGAPAFCAGSVGTSHLALVEVTGGTSLSVCEDDYGPFMVGLGQAVIDHALPTSYVLRESARRDTLH